ncbi:Spx/MgsR family RNA polymerase-binding regulatory protein [Sulfuricurvum sp. IAE1]|uniref:arsenate reductase family protein n=1 Tax=Sulfuricurvum sp. IAE1 TaxID=2546102 RepID=UPI00104BDB46|nr:arsenate reductase family protein [Sulfuricurvum sp. IAE1]TDA64131.1 Spx/MgsR family RNA polymerase-binding regulatory protein [Sulfuricurvum sp. IAE1]
MVRVFGIKNCDSVKKALQFLNAHSVPYEFHDFKTAPVGKEKISQWGRLVPVSTLFNTKGTTYRTLGLKSLALDDSGKIGWMSEHNLLIKRPVIESPKGLIVGFDPSQYEGIFAHAGQ